MNIGEITGAIESVEFDANMGLISGFRRFVRMALSEPQTLALVAALTASRRCRVMVESRIEQLMTESLALEHVHPRDIALAVYVLALHEVGSARLLELAKKLAENPMGWWSRNAARRVLTSVAEAEARGLRYRFDWSKAPDDPARGRLQLWVGDESVWHDHNDSRAGLRGIAATWSVFLERLSEVWPRIVWEDGFPAPIDARDPSEFDVKTRDYLDGVPTRLIESKSAMFDEYRASHDISKIAPEDAVSLWFVRQGRRMWVCTNSSDVCVDRPRREVVAILRSMGDSIAERLELDHQRYAQALEAWERAEKIEPELKISLYTGLSLEQVEEFGAARGFELGEDESDETELMAAARMLAQADFRAVLPEVLQITREVPAPTDSRNLDSISLAIDQELAKLPLTSKPHEQGYLAANWLRAHFNAGNSSVSPTEILARWSVDVIRRELSEPEIEAIAVWGPRHGPAIILNQHAKFSSPTRERITLAHEIAHLVLDRRGALPLAEVLGGNLPKLVEQRARAFAAELLLPRTVAGVEFFRSQNPDHTLALLSNQYSVSQEVVAWQARNSDSVLPRSVENFLRTKVSRPESYGY